MTHPSQERSTRTVTTPKEPATAAGMLLVKLPTFDRRLADTVPVIEEQAIQELAHRMAGPIAELFASLPLHDPATCRRCVATPQPGEDR